MEEEKNVVEAVPTPAEEPVKVAPELEEKPVETEDAFVEESLGQPKETPQEEPVEEKKEELQETPEVTQEEKQEEKPLVEEEKQEVVERPSRLDKRLKEKYSENLLLKNGEMPSQEEMERELSQMTLDEKKTALRNILDENRTMRGKNPEPLSVEDEEALIEAEVERRYQQEKAEVDKIKFQEDLTKTLEKYPELDKRTEQYNEKLERAVLPLVQSGMLASEAYGIIREAVENAKKEMEKSVEIARQKSMAGSVISLDTPEKVKKEPQSEEDKFLADALGE